MRTQWRRIRVGLAVVIALSTVFLIDAEFARVVGHAVFHFGWITAKGTESGGVRVFHEAVFIFLEGLIWVLAVAVQVGPLWLVWWYSESRALRSASIMCDEDRGTMSFEKTLHDFKFQSTLGGVLLLWLFGIIPVWLALEDFRSSVIPRGYKGPFSFLPFLYNLFLYVLGWVILNSVAHVQILDGEFHFSRLRNWKSVPLESITRVRHLGPAVYVRVDYTGKRYRFVFSPEDFRLGPSPPPVIGFLQEVCRRNAEKSESRP